MITKKELAIKLSKLSFERKKEISLEQYDTEAEVAAEMLWFSYMNDCIENKIIVDFGCGSGILGIGALLLGAKKVYFLDVDKNAINLAKKNVKNIFGTLRGTKFILDEVTNFDYIVDTVVMNPPFGVQVRKADKTFLEVGMKISDSIFSLHKIESKEFIAKLAKENSFEVVTIKGIKLLLKKTYSFHKKDRYYIGVGLWWLRRKF